jgi:hypothetical protein
MNNTALMKLKIMSSVIFLKEVPERIVTQN